MEVKLKIIEISPKIKSLKNNSKDIISISFISDNYSVKIEDVEKAMNNNDNIIINLKQANNKNKIQAIKYSLIKNINNIISTGEFTPIEGTKWYKLSEIKNNISKVNFLASSKSKDNIRNNNNYQQVNLLKIKFEIKISNKMIMNKNKNNDNHDKIRKNNYTKEQSSYSSEEKANLFDKKDFFNDEDFTIIESEINKKNSHEQATPDTKNFKNKKYLSGSMSKKYIKNTKSGNTQSPSSPGSISRKDKINPKRIKSSEVSPIKKKSNHLAGKFLFNEDLKMKTVLDFNKKKNIDKNSNLISGKDNLNIEDEILDQNFKNYLKNDEILKSNLSKNNSSNSLTQNSIKNENEINYMGTFDPNNYDYISQTTRTKGEEINKKEFKNKKIIIQDLNTNSLFADIQLLKTNSDCEYVTSNDISKNIISNNDNDNISFEDIPTVNNNENYEKLKSDFLLLYSEENINKINNDILFFEIQLMIEKILGLQNEHQKEYISLFSSIKSNINTLRNYQFQYLSLFKQLNSLRLKKLYHDNKDKKKELYNENIAIFIDDRKKIIKKEEFPIWDKMVEHANITAIQKNNKSRITDIFLEICDRNENNLNKLSVKFYKEIKDKNSSQENINIGNKKSKYKSLNYTVKRTKSRVKENDDLDNNLQYMKTNQNFYNNQNTNSKPNKSKYTLKKKKLNKTNLIKDDNNITNNNNMNYGTIMNQKYSHYNIRKNNNYKNKSTSIGDKFVNKKRGVNKSQ